MKKEREHKKKQQALTLEETKAEIANTEAKLAQLKEEKHQLFHTLKKVIHDDDRRRNKEVSHTQKYLQTTMRPNPSLHYMKSPAHLLMTQTGGSSANSLTAHSLPPAQKRPRSPSPPRSSINSAYYRTPQGSSASKYSSSPYATSAVASVSASAIYAHTTNASTSHHYNVAAAASRGHEDADRGKPVYLTQSVPQAIVTAQGRSSYSTSLAVAAAERDRAAVVAQQRALAAAAAPPAAHGGGSSSSSSFRSGSILSGYPRTAAYTIASNAPSAQSPRLVQAPQGQPQPNGTMRYYTQQREV